jgi:hypothetical protein
LPLFADLEAGREKLGLEPGELHPREIWRTPRNRGGGVPPILIKHSDGGTQPNGSKSVMTAECFFIGRQVLRKHSFEETLRRRPPAYRLDWRWG